MNIEQLEAYKALEDRYPDHLAPSKAYDDNGLMGVFFNIRVVDADETGCDGLCDEEHIEYDVILPYGEVMSDLAGRTVVSGTFGEFALGLDNLRAMAQPMTPDDWETEASLNNVDDLLADIFGPEDEDMRY